MIIRCIIPCLFLASCARQKATLSQEKSESITYSMAVPERGGCLNATSLISEVDKKVLESSKQKDLVVEGSNKGPCPDSLKVLDADAKLIKKCDSYQDKAAGDPTTYQWYIYDKRVVEGKIVPTGKEDAEKICSEARN